MASVIHQSQKRPTDAYGCNSFEGKVFPSNV